MIRPIEIQTESEEQTRSIARALGTRLQGGEVVTLEGELGAGKTVFVRGLAQGLGINPAGVSSPTFVIRQEYSHADQQAPVLVHIDAYRLSGPDELETIGWHELLHDGSAVLAIEWPSRIEPALPDEQIRIEIQHTGTHTRLVTIAAPESLRDRLQDVIAAWPESSQGHVDACRTCGMAIPRTSQHFPFCSERCRLADLGTWFNEGYRVSRPVEADEELED